MKNYIVTGYQGELHFIGVAEVSAYKTLDSDIKGGKIPGFLQLTPLVEISPDFKPRLLKTNSNSLEELTNVVAHEYANVIEEGFAPGADGDLLSILEIDGNYILSSIGHKAFFKPELAADLGLVLKGKNESGEDAIYLITGKRKANPGKGKPAWFGGFREVSFKEGDLAYQLDSGVYTALKEGFEEGSVKIDCQNISDLRTNYDADNVSANINLDQKYFPAQILYLGTIKTSDDILKIGGEKLSDNHKRVHATSGYLCVADLGNTLLNQDNLNDWFEAGDDIKSLVFTDITLYVQSGKKDDLSSKLEFGIQHHNDFIKSVIEKSHQFFYDN